MLAVLGGVVALLTVLGFTWGPWWRFDWVSHFRVQYSLSLAIVVLGLLVFRRFRADSVFAVFGFLNLALIAPDSIGGTSVEAFSVTVFRAAIINVHTANPRADLVRDFVSTQSPDVILFEEVDRGWLERLSPLRETYPHWESEPRSDNFGIALASKRARFRNPMHQAHAGVTPAVSVDSVSRSDRSLPRVVRGAGDRPPRR